MNDLRVSLILQATEGLTRAGNAADTWVRSAGGMEGIATSLGEKMGALAGAIASVGNGINSLVERENQLERFLGFDSEKFGLVGLASGKMELGKAVRADLEAAAKPIEQGTTWIRRKIGLEPEPDTAGAASSVAEVAGGRSVATAIAAREALRAQQLPPLESRVRLEFSGLPQGMRVQTTAASPGLDLITEIQRRGPSMAGP